MAAKKRRHWPWFLLTFLIVLGGAVFAVRSINAKPVKIDPEKLAKVERIDLARSVVATGKVEPVTKVEIKSKASGIIQKLPVNVGDYVRKGQVICELDQNDLLPALREQEAALHVAQANVESAKADYAKYKVDAQGPDVPFLKRDMERARRMFADGLIAQNTKDDAEKN
jgi:HlyD family secretion protein